MEIEKDGIIKKLSDTFMLGDYIAAGWKIANKKQLKTERKESEKEEKKRG